MNGLGRKMYFICTVSNKELTCFQSASYIEEGHFAGDKLNFGRKMECDASTKIGWFRC